MRFVVTFGFISALADIVYEGARSFYGPLLASFGATALVVSVVTGGGDAAALVLRLVFGRLADARRRRWALTITGYALTVAAVPLLGVVPALWMACGLILLERIGKSVRSPAKDAMLAQAGTVTGRGWAFAVHEAMDQTGAFVGPLIVAALFAATASFGPPYLALAIPGLAVLAVLVWLRRQVPDTGVYEPDVAVRPEEPGRGGPLPRAFWIYLAFTCLGVTGFATFGLLSFHLSEQSLVPTAAIPVVYAAAMAVDAIAALISGRVYDRVGLRGLVALPVLMAIVPWLAFSTSTAAAIAGVLVWGAALGIQESTLRAAVADLVDDRRRGSAYGIFSAGYGLAWLLGSLLIGVLYEQSLVLTAAVITGLQVAALAVFLVVRPHRHHQTSLDR